ncbi:5-formyltetrahydrofolate cyclo-ligase [Sphingomonas sp. Y38-1Y]|uniref:5-formyltetrahydrofolate cyclo-ligase n=1 Tax=Sphingomonas sp. Y38-1Y TaxID=3078265 RepID=UPI0028E70596|nr:5-formyltetrahydrofolate cyclo-ligase [Sphingomonas sp. Y38-1Y]
MNPAPAPSIDKPALRARLRGLRDAFVIDGAPPIAPPAAYLARLRRSLCVAAYVPLGSEADPAPLVEAALAAGCTLALPRTLSRARPIAFHAFAPGDPLEVAAFGLRQPLADAPVATPDIVLVPLVGFDGACNRLGQGAGHYDRALVGLPGVYALGIAYSVQQVPALPVDPWDRVLDAIVTETRLIERNTAS